MTDALGNPVRFILTGGNEADCMQAFSLIEAVPAGTIPGDKGYGTDAFVDAVAEMGSTVIIPPRVMRKERNLATRCAMRARNFKALLYLVATLVWIV